MGISWSKMRNILEEENICDSLKGRIQYFVTRYVKSHDQEGRVAIRLDGNEVFRSNYYDWDKKSTYVHKHVPIPNIDKMSWREFWFRILDETKSLGGFDQYGFYDAFYAYQNSSIEDSLQSTDPVVRLFAILDKRVGKRRLQKILPDVTKQPAWLQMFYFLRLEADGILPWAEP